MKKFFVKEDIPILKLKKGDSISVEDKFELNNDGFPIVLSLEQIESDMRFEPYQTNDLQFTISEVKEDEDEIKSFRIQLDVKTTKRKMINIENFLRQSLDELL